MEDSSTAPIFTDGEIVTCSDSFNWSIAYQLRIAGDRCYWCYPIKEWKLAEAYKHRSRLLPVTDDTIHYLAEGNRIVDLLPWHLTSNWPSISVA